MQHSAGTGRFGVVKRMLVPVIVGAALAVLAPAPTWAQAPTAEALKQMEDQLFVLVNQARAAAGLAPYTRASELDASARRHSLDMATTGNFSHYGTDGSTPAQRANAAGYDSTYVGENIAGGQATAQAAMDTWMNEPPPAGHRAAILDANYKEIGISVEYHAGTVYGYYWTQDFGARAVAPPAELSPSGYTLTSSIRSVAGTTGTSIEFVNQTAGVIFVSWIDYQGGAVLYASLQPGQAYVQQTYVTHPWIVLDANARPIGIYTATERPGRAAIGG
jgi:uncharacterized protein YkwD